MRASITIALISTFGPVGAAAQGNPTEHSPQAVAAVVAAFKAEREQLRKHHDPALRFVWSAANPEVRGLVERGVPRLGGRLLETGEDVLQCRVGCGFRNLPVDAVLTLNHVTMTGNRAEVWVAVDVREVHDRNLALRFVDRVTLVRSDGQGPWTVERMDRITSS